MSLLTELEFALGPVRYKHVAPTALLVKPQVARSWLTRSCVSSFCYTGQTEG